MSDILKIRIDRNIAGKRIPFDVIYLFPRESRDLIARLWDFAMVLPMEKSFKEVIFTLPVGKVSHLKFHRDDDATNLEVGVEDAPNPRKKDKAISSTWATLNDKYQLDDRIIAVPLLLSRKEDKFKPRYLTAQQWFLGNRNLPGKAKSLKSAFTQAMNNPVSSFRPAVPDLAYVVTPFPAPDNVIRPICSVCPRSLLHLQGQCIPGMAVCYESLNLNLRPDKSSIPLSEPESLEP